MTELNTRELYEFFISRNMEYSFHANTVRTSCTFIEQKGLLSRGCVEYNELIQTEQSSDDIDRFFGIWNDIFVDVVDLHGYFPRQNLYGPVCFVIDNEFLLDKSFPDICITKDNPIYWNETMSEREKYYCSVQEYIAEFDYNIKSNKIHSKMITICDTHKKIPFDRYLVKIVLDNPGVLFNDIDLYEKAKQELLHALKNAGFKKGILETRVCSNCFCHSNYLEQVGPDELEKLFL